MGKHHVKVLQLRSSCGNTFLNVGDSDGGSLCVSGVSFERPTYLMIDGSHFKLIAFSDEAWAKEGLEKYREHYEHLWHISDGKLEKVDWKEISVASSEES